MPLIAKRQTISEIKFQTDPLPQDASPCHRNPFVVILAAGRAGNRVAEIDRAAYAFEQMNAAPKSIYLFLSPEKDFASFCCILTKMRKAIETIDAVGLPVFSMLS
jgi:hypothetical protein